MRLFKSDLFRSFAIGFALGAVAICFVFGGGDGNFGAHMVPQAQAAPAH